MNLIEALWRESSLHLIKKSNSSLDGIDIVYDSYDFTRRCVRFHYIDENKTGLDKWKDSLPLWREMGDKLRGAFDITFDQPCLVSFSRRLKRILRNIETETDKDNENLVYLLLGLYYYFPVPGSYFIDGYIRQKLCTNLDNEICIFKCTYDKEKEGEFQSFPPVEISCLAQSSAPTTGGGRSTQTT